MAEKKKIICLHGMAEIDGKDFYNLERELVKRLLQKTKERKGENIIESVLPNSLNLYNDAQKSCLKMTTGLWAEKFGVSL